MSPSGSKWCEACGHDLNESPKLECTSCGEAAVEDDGYCHSCGHRQPVARDHWVVTDGDVVAVSDRGQRHHHNEDAVAAKSLPDGGAVVVVCDGVSSTPGSAEVSAAAAEAAAAVLVDGMTATPQKRGEAGPDTDDALRSAVEAAQQAAIDATTVHGREPGSDGRYIEPPSSTLVAAVAQSDDDRVAVSVAWLGDSRAYWLDRSGVHPLTADHEVNGALSRWLGADGGSHEPELAHFSFLPEPVDGEGATPAGELGMLLVCSDGLWRYFEAEVGEQADQLVGRLRSEGLNGVNLAEALVEFANQLGGHDNISVALWPSATHTHADPDVDPEAASKSTTEPTEQEVTR